MAKDRPPSFPFYPANWLADTMLMSRDKRSRYMEAICHSWLEESYGVAEVGQWRRWLGYSEKEWAQARDHFAPRFKIEFFGEREVWTQKKLVEIREDQLARYDRARAGGVALQKQRGVTPTPQGALQPQVVANTRPTESIASASPQLEVSLGGGQSFALEAKSLEPKISCAAPGGAARASDRQQKAEEKTEWVAAFDEFWKHYPPRGALLRRAGKDEAMRAWMKIKPCDQNAKAIWVALDKDIAEWSKRDPEFIPMASTWLNKGRWKDEL